MLRVEEALAHEGDDAEERHGIGITPYAARKLHVQGDRRPHDLDALAVVAHAANLRIVGGRRDVDQRAASLENHPRRRREHRRDAAAGEPGELGRLLEMARGLELRPEDQAPLPALGFLGRAQVRRLRLCGSDLEARRVAHVDEPGVDSQARAVDRDRVGRRLHVCADRLDQPAPNHDRPRADRRARGRHQPRPLDRVDLRRVGAAGGIHHPDREDDGDDAPTGESHLGSCLEHFIREAIPAPCTFRTTPDACSRGRRPSPR